MNGPFEHDKYEAWELWEYDAAGVYQGALSTTFPSWRAAQRERRNMGSSRTRVRWRIVGFYRGQYYFDNGAPVDTPARDTHLHATASGGR